MLQVFLSLFLCNFPTVSKIFLVSVLVSLSRFGLVWFDSSIFFQFDSSLILLVSYTSVPAVFALPLYSLSTSSFVLTSFSARAVRVWGLEPVFRTVRLACYPFLFAACVSELSSWFSGTGLIFLLSLLCLSNSAFVLDTAVEFMYATVLLFLNFVSTAEWFGFLK